VTALNLADDDEGMSDPTALAIWGYGPRHELQSGILQTGKVNQYIYIYIYIYVRLFLQ